MNSFWICVLAVAILTLIAGVLWLIEWRKDNARMKKQYEEEKEARRKRWMEWNEEQHVTRAPIPVRTYAQQQTRRSPLREPAGAIVGSAVSSAFASSNSSDSSSSSSSDGYSGGGGSFDGGGASSSFD